MDTFFPQRISAYLLSGTLILIATLPIGFLAAFPVTELEKKALPIGAWTVFELLFILFALFWLLGVLDAWKSISISKSEIIVRDKLRKVVFSRRNVTGVHIEYEPFVGMRSAKLRIFIIGEQGSLASVTLRDLSRFKDRQRFDKVNAEAIQFFTKNGIEVNQTLI